MKKVLITGASEGIGLELAKLFAQKNNQVTLVARNKEKLEKALQQLSGKEHSYLTADLSKKEDAHKIANHIEENHYDTLINNAGVCMYGRFEVMPIQEQAQMMHLNMYGLTILAHSFLKSAKKGDALVNTASTLGVTSFPGAAVYSATKAYVVNLSESLWWENKKRDVFVIGFCPGVTDTAFHETAGGNLPAKMYPRFIIQTPRQAAEELYRALEKRRKPRAVSGVMNRLMLFFYRFLSRSMVVNTMGGFSPIKD